jgi:hypothetical protein
MRQRTEVSAPRERSRFDRFRWSKRIFLRECVVKLFFSIQSANGFGQFDLVDSHKNLFAPNCPPERIDSNGHFAKDWSGLDNGQQDASIPDEIQMVNRRNEFTALLTVPPTLHRFVSLHFLELFPVLGLLPGLCCAECRKSLQMPRTAFSLAHSVLVLKF